MTSPRSPEAGAGTRRPGSVRGARPENSTCAGCAAAG
eukprot:CAMPEP_0179217056 /NCGR_PEP_ID=MMETSP0797-20121207/3717_1 /TAXON_ID=47934 /ORGANISM="Dinophysis acuminata, Strain DAEP01" /LENGTH=36 /DNA_ID= /DNA_START= /DNA_END= /DNA_ORIENTATION=